MVIPAGSDVNPLVPGYERVFQSRRDAQKTEWRREAASGVAFLDQPPPENGPDGTGPYRVCRRQKEGPVDEQGYTVEIFLPRSLFKVPVFAPGWYIGFDAAVGIGRQQRGPDLNGQAWSSSQDAVKEAISPKSWGDMLLLGTDPYMVVQEASADGATAQSIVPGHSYLLTIVDPDRNIYATEKDTVQVSAEVAGDNQDIEVFTLTET